VAAQRAFVPHDDVIEALTPEGADHARSTNGFCQGERGADRFFDAPLQGSTPQIGMVGGRMCTE